MRDWVAIRHRAVQATCGGVLVAAGIGLEVGTGWALTVLGALLLVDLAKDHAFSRRKR